MADRWVTWRVATERALYGPSGFYRRHRPAAHFRTSVHASPLIAEAFLSLARGARLRAVVDVGAGSGELLVDLHRLAPDLSLTGVDVAGRPAGLPASIGWTGSVPRGADVLLVAHELLDDVPVEVAEHDGRCWRLVLVDPATGEERAGDQATGRDADWLDRWWPAAGPGARAEVGGPRDETWAGLVGSLRRGVAVAVDYAHDRHSRPVRGSVTAYRDGRQVRPVPDGSCDVTSHVALDACAAAGVLAGATATVRTDQRTALAALGVTAPRPPHALAQTDPAAYVRALSARGELAELSDPAGLGGFGWLVQGVGAALPPGLRAAQAPTGTES